MLTYPDRTYFLSNDSSSGADARVITPVTTNPATTINGAAYYDLNEYQDCVELAPYAIPASCGDALTSGACSALSAYGCSVKNATCSYNTMDNTCTGNAVCPAHDGNQSACEAQTYFSSCAGGTYYTVKEWRIYAEKKAKAAMLNVDQTFTARQGFVAVRMGYVAKTANYTLTTSDYTVDCTSGTFTITLPTAVGTSGYGQIFNIKNSGTGIITINTTSSQTIDGQASGAITLNQYDNLMVQSNNTNWIIL